MNEELPLRHGWGGNKNKRAKALREKRENIKEQKQVPEKFTPDSTPLDKELLEQMQKPRK